MRNDWNTPMPRLDEVQRQAEAMNAVGNDVHTIHIVLSGHSGNFDVTMEATSSDMEDIVATYELDRNGHCKQTGVTTAGGR